MSDPSALPAWLAGLLARVVPRDRRAEVIGDLCEDYRRVRQRSGRIISASWLGRETLSLAAAWSVRGGSRAWRARSFLWRDLHSAMRSLRRQPLPTAGAAAMLAVGLVAVMLAGALAATLLSRPVSAAHGAALVRIGAVQPSGRMVTRFSLVEVEHLARHVDAAARITSVGLEPVLIRAGGARTQTLGEIVGTDYFELMGIAMRIGRPLLDVDHRQAAPPAAVISTTLWRDLFASDPAALGAIIHLNRHPFTVAGIAAAGVSTSLLGGSVDVWVPQAHGDAFLNRGWRTDIAERPFSVFALPVDRDAGPSRRLEGPQSSTNESSSPQALQDVSPRVPRLRSGRPEPWSKGGAGQNDAVASGAAPHPPNMLAGSRRRLAGSLAAAAAGLAQIAPDPWREQRFAVLPGTSLLGSQQRAAAVLSSILGVLAAVILAVAVTNVGGVMLARAEAERRSAAIHIAIGAGAGAPVRRRLVEGALIGLLGAAFAIGLYAWARTRIAEVALLPTLTLRLDLPLGADTILWTAAAGAAGGLLLAVGPALWTARLDVIASLGAGGRITGDRRVARVRRALVAAQVALSLVLIAGAALFGKSLQALAAADIGVPRSEGDHVVAMDFDIEPSTPASGGSAALARQALQRAGALPEVLAAAMSNRAPIDSSTPTIEVHPPGADAARLDVTFNLATPRYFDVVGVPLLRGRTFTGDDTSRSDVAIVNESLARRFWTSEDPIGRGLTLVAQQRTVRIIGIARDAKYRTIAESGQPHLYLPTEPRFGLAMLIRTAGEPRRTLQLAQDAFDDLGPGVVGFFPRTMDDHLAIALLPARVAAAAAAWLGAMALALSAVGLYGLVSWFVERRRREIGLRMTLGANPRDIRRLIVGQALRTAGPGLLIGTGLAAAGGAAARSALFGVGPFDPAALATGIGALLVIVGAASWAPARRAAKTDPAATLRS